MEEISISSIQRYLILRLLMLKSQVEMSVGKQKSFSNIISRSGFILPFRNKYYKLAISLF